MTNNIIEILKSIKGGVNFGITYKTSMKEAKLKGWYKVQNYTLKNCGYEAMTTVKQYREQTGIVADTSKQVNEVAVDGVSHVFYNTNTGNTYLRVPLEYASTLSVEYHNQQGECVFTDKEAFNAYRASLGYAPKKSYPSKTGQAVLCLSLNNIVSIRVGGHEYTF